MSGWMIAWTRPGAALLRHDDGRVESGFEFLVRDRIIAEGLDAFVPAIRSERVTYSWARRARNGTSAVEKREPILHAAFSRYILFRATDVQPVWQIVAHDVDGVTMVVPGAGDRTKPGILPERVVTKLLGPAGDGVIEDLTKTMEELETFAAETPVTVKEGPFAGFPGVVVGQEKRWLEVAVAIFGRDTPVHIQIDQVERVA